MITFKKIYDLVFLYVLLFFGGKMLVHDAMWRHVTVDARLLNAK